MADSSRIPRRILHTSDLHLIRVSDRACQSLEALVDIANKSKVDLVIIAGDLFDHNRVDDDLVSFVAEQLQRVPVYVAILPGNHDCLMPGSVYNRIELWRGATNVRVFRAPDGETLSLPGLGVSLWGKAHDSYGSDLRPLAGIPKPQEDGQWHIAVAHGYYYTSAAPFLSYHITEEEIVASGHDYVALGHLITFRCVSSKLVKAYYSGSPSWSFPDSTVNIVDLAEGTGVQVTRYSLRDK